MSYSEAYTPTNWVNLPSQDTALEADNLNHMEQGIKTNDTRVTEIGNNAMYASDVANCLFGQPTYDKTTGTFTFPKKGGGSFTLNTDLEKLAINFDFDEDTQTLIIYLDDGTTKVVDLSAFTKENEFVDSATISFTVTGHEVTAVVKAHSIGENELEVNYRTACENAKSDAEAAATSSEAWAVGQIDGVDVPSTNPAYHNNAKYYAGQADALGQAQAETAESWAVGKRGGTDVPSTDPAYHNNAKYYASSASTDATYAHDAIDTINRMLQVAQFTVNTTTGNLEYNSDTAYIFTVNEQTGNLEWEVSLV